MRTICLYTHTHTQFGVPPWHPDGSINPAGVAYGRAADDEIAFHAARALSLLSSHGANQRKILEHGGLQMMYGLARLADPDIQAEAATVIANVTSTIYDAQIQACHRLRDHLSTAPRLSPPPSAYL